MHLLFLIFLSAALAPSGGGASCGYDSCPVTQPEMLNVHLVPHSHDDVGWLKTVDEYYYGSRKNITPVGVQYILDSVIPELLGDPSKRFIFVEMAFFYRWWDEQEDPMKGQVRGLVENGQLEFILGGWCMNDEASTHYNAIIDQMSWGLKKLNDTFGECARPRVAWQIDPFGHSKEQANIFAQMGFDGLFFGRLDYADKDKRLRDQTMEMVWEGSHALGKSSRLFTGALYNGYGPPDGFCFDIFCDDEPIMDNPRLHDYNADKRVDEFLAAVRDQAQHYNTNHIVMTMGSDFHYMHAGSWFKNLDKLIKHANARQASKGSKINLLYSTPSCYLKSVHDSGHTYQTKRDDFFPYASDPHAYWTGYFTSRPALKYMVRSGNNFLQVCKQLGAITAAAAGWQMDSTDGDVTVMREAMAVLQHHDGVSGTAKQAVTFDYAQRLAEGFTECEKVVDHAYQILSPKKGSNKHTQHFCRLLNMTECASSEENDRFVVNVYNPLAKKVSKYVRLPVSQPGYEVIAPNGESIVTQIVPVPKAVKAIPGRKSRANFELVFRADLHPLGYKSFYVRRNQSVAELQLSYITTQRKSVIGNELISLDMRGNVKRIVMGDGEVMKLEQTFGYYAGHEGNNSEFELRASGAYIFRPASQKPTLMVARPNPTVVKGPLVQEIHQEFSDFASQVVRVYAGSGDAEFEWLVGPIPVDDGVGKEVITRYKTDLETKGIFFTDSNGRQLLERTRNVRPTWDLNVTEPVSGNYYPVNSRVAVKQQSDGAQLTVLTDRSQGGTSMNDGEVELMLHRRLLWDDAFGVGEPLNETAFEERGLVVRGKHWVQASPGGGDQSAARRHRLAAQQIFMDAALSFVPTELSFKEWRSKYNMAFSSLGLGVSGLPPNVHLLTLEEWNGNVLVRLENFFDENEDPELSRPAKVLLNDLFSAFKITKVEELTLGGNLRADNLQRLDWNVEEDNDVSSWDNFAPAGDVKFRPAASASAVAETSDDKMEITLSPMQIRTFVVELEPRPRQPVKSH